MVGENGGKENVGARSMEAKSMKSKSLESNNKGNHTMQKWNMDRIAAAFLYLSVTLEILIVIVDKSNYTNPIEGQLFRITFLLAACKILLTKYSFKEWVAMALFGLLGLVSYKATGRNEILRIVVFIAACKGMDMKQVLKYVFYTTLAGCAFLIFLSVTGIYGELALEADFGRGYTQVRYCLGLGHPNALHCMAMMLMLLGLYLYNEKIKWYYYVILFAMNYGLYVLTDSNTGFLMTCCGIVGAVVIHYWKSLKGHKWVYVAGALVFLACVTFSVLAAESRFTKPSNYWFENSFIGFIECHLNGRIKDLYYGTQTSQGTTATWDWFSNPESQQYFDMGHVRVFYWYGIVPGVVYVVLNLWLFWQCYRKKDGMGLVMMTVLAVYTVVEAHIVSVYIGRNYILFLLAMYSSDMLGLSSDREEYLWKSYRLLGKMERL